MATPFNPLTLKLQELQQRQQIANQMMQQGMTPVQGQVSGTGSNPIYVKPSPWQALASVAQTAAGGYLQNQTNKQYSDIADQMTAAQTKALMDLSGGGTAPQGSSGAPPVNGTPSTAGVPPPLITNPGYTPPNTSTPPGAGFPQGNPGMPDSSFARKLVGYQNAATYGVDPEVIKIAAANDAPTNEMKNVAAVYGQGSPQYQAALERSVNPAVATNANSPLARFNPQTGQYETAYAPPNIEKGTSPIIQNGQIVGVTGLPGANETAAAHEAAITAATEAQKGKWIDDPLHPGQGRFAYPTPPALPGGGVTDLGNVGRPSGNAPTAATLEGMKTGAKTGTDYAAELTAKANDALAGKRTLSEMTNLLQGFTPGKFAPVLSSLGSAAQALGADPATIQKLTNINPGDAEAFQKGTAALAGEAAKQVTNRVTQTEFKVFLANNPNWMMTPGGIKRVMDFMGKGFDQQLDQQQQFAQWSRGAPPDRWAIDFPAEYNKRQAAVIKAGGTNSTPPTLTPTETSTDLGASAGVATKIASKAEFDKLASGTKFVGPDGITYRKP